jgi:hypothetical protein
MFGQVEHDRQFSIEVDPAPYLLNGYSVSLKYSPKKLPKTAFMASVYQSNFPNSMMSEENKSKGWTNLKIKTSYAIFAEFYLNAERKGFYFGPSVFWYNKNVTLQQAQTNTTFQTVYPNVRTGYVWYPFKKLNFYLNPWLNIGSEISIDDKNQIEGIEFKPNSFNYIIALHLGYRFK